MHGGFSAHLVLCLFHALWCIIMLTIWQSFSLAESLQVDSATTVALMTNEGGLPGVSVDMHMTYMKVKEESIERFDTVDQAAKLGELIEIEARTVKKGRTLAFLECEIRNAETGAILVKGNHTKFIGG